MSCKNELDESSRRTQLLRRHKAEGLRTLRGYWICVMVTE